MRASVDFPPPLAPTMPKMLRAMMNGITVQTVSSLIEPAIGRGTSASLRELTNVENRPETIPDSATITGIWVYGGRSACGGS